MILLSSCRFNIPSFIPHVSSGQRDVKGTVNVLMTCTFPCSLIKFSMAVLGTK